MHHDIKGFGVRIRPSGRKTYIVKYRDRGRAVKVTIGPHGAISPAAARARAAEIVTAVRTGKDLSGGDLRDAKAPTVAELGRRFLDEYVTDHCKPNTKRQYRKMVEDYILPRLGARPAPDVQRIDVASLHHDMRATPTNANRVLATLLLMLTGCRRNEILTLRWEHVDLDAAEIHLADGKTGARTVHLSPSAVRVLKALPRKPGNPWVIPGNKPGRHMTDIDGSWEVIRTRAGLHDVRIHDIRHSCASRLDFLAAKEAVNHWFNLSFSLLQRSRKLRPLQSVII